MIVNGNEATQQIIRCYQKGGKLLLCGNGGSAADCAHIAGELGKGFLKKRPLPQKQINAIGEAWAEELQQGLPAIDLTAGAALLSAILNDLGGENVFAQQVLAYGRPGDVLLCISTSGNAENVRRAAVTAKALGMTVIGLTGETGGKLREVCDLCVRADETETYRVQEKHLQFYHRMCIEIENAFFAE